MFKYRALLGALALATVGAGGIVAFGGNDAHADACPNPDAPPTTQPGDTLYSVPVPPEVAQRVAQGLHACAVATVGWVTGHTEQSAP